MKKMIAILLVSTMLNTAYFGHTVARAEDKCIEIEQEHRASASHTPPKNNAADSGGTRAGTSGKQSIKINCKDESFDGIEAVVGGILVLGAIVWVVHATEGHGLMPYQKPVEIPAYVPDFYYSIKGITVRWSVDF